MKQHIFPAIRLTLISIFLLALAYPAFVLCMAQLTPQKGKGELIDHNGQSMYGNIGQKFTEDKYFQSRPSAVDFNAAGSGGSNKGPSNPDYLATVLARIDTFLAHNPGVTKNQIPVDLVTASGSGLDPHISVQAAYIQVKRISTIRRIAEANLQELILNHTEKPLAGFLGPSRVNVVKLNLALDHLY